MTKLDQLQVACKAQLAYAHFLREDWDTVRELLESYIDKAASAEVRDKASWYLTSSKNYYFWQAKCYSCFSLAIAKYMLNHNAECAELMKKCIEYEDKTSSWDAYSVSVARAYLANGNKFDRCTLLFLLIDNANEAGNHERALKYLDEVEALSKWEDFTADDRLAMHAYYKGE